jgi:hypothetical protein
VTFDPLLRRAALAFAVGTGWLVFAVFADSGIRWAAVGLGLGFLTSGMRRYVRARRNAATANPATADASR